MGMGRHDRVWRQTALLGACMMAAALGPARAGESLLPQTGRILVLPQGEKVVVTGLLGANNAAVKEPTTVTLTWHERGLEAVYECADSAIAAAVAKERDNEKVWKDDCVGLFLDVGHTHDAEKEPRAFLLSAAGGLFDRRGKDIAWNAAGGEAQVTTTDQGWTARLFVPWQGLGATPKVGDAWGLNLTRIDHEGKAYANMRFIAWAPFAKDYELLDQWGHVIFAAPGAKAGDASLAPAQAALTQTHDALATAKVYPHAGSILELPRGEPATFAGLTSKVTGRPEQQKTSVAVRWDEQALVVALDCADTAIAAEYKERDAIKMWKDDSVSLFLDPGHTHNLDQKLVFIQVNALGAVHDARDGKLEYNLAGVEAKMTRDDKGWRGELRVPWAGLELPAPQPGDVWGFYVSRNDQPGHYDYTQTDWTAWPPNPTGLDLLLDRWGHLLFLDAKGSAGNDAARQRATTALTATHAARTQALREKFRLQVE